MLGEMLALGANVNMYAILISIHFSKHHTRVLYNMFYLRRKRIEVELTHYKHWGANKTHPQLYSMHSFCFCFSFLRYMFEGGTNFGYWNGKEVKSICDISNMST